jgi:hypothetical protein
MAGERGIIPAIVARAVIRIGRKRPFSCFDHGFLWRAAGGAVLWIGIQQHDPILHHDAHHHDQAHEGGKIESCLSGKESEENTRGGKQSLSQNRGGSGEIAKFNRQHDENENGGSQKHEFNLAAVLAGSHRSFFQEASVKLMVKVCCADRVTVTGRKRKESSTFDDLNNCRIS